MFENDDKNRQEFPLVGINKEDNYSVFNKNNENNINNNNTVQQILGCNLLREQKYVEFAMRNVKLALKFWYALV